MKYNWRPCLDSQPGQPPHQQHSASKPAADQITKPSMRTHVTSEQNLRPHLIIQHNLRPQTTMKPCPLPLLITQSIQLHPLVREHSLRHHPARRDGRGRTALPNHRIQPGRCGNGEHSLQIHSTGRGFRVLLVSPCNLGAH